MVQDRIIGRYTGREKGPLLICIGGMHGNEPAGVQALTRIFKMIENEPNLNPDFVYKGRIVGLVGNLQALDKNSRYVEKDLNRQFIQKNIDRVFSTPYLKLENEDVELRDLIEVIRFELEDYPSEKVYFLDLHTTSSEGGIFCITTDDAESIRIAVELHAPVILGFLQDVKGTTMHYFNTKNLGRDTTALTFESGQHDDLLSINRAIAGITNCMRSIGSVIPEHVENKHDSLLIEYSENLPKVSRLLKRHAITVEDQFKMLPDYLNFQPVNKGEVVAYDQKGPIVVNQDCRILMPLYQNQGEEGFYLIKETNENNGAVY